MHRRIDLEAYLSRGLNRIIETPPGMRVTLLSFRQLVEAGHRKTIDYPEKIRRRFDEGHRCIGVYCESELAHVAWLTVGSLPIDDGVPSVFADKLGGAFDGFTEPEFRGRGCLTLAVQEICMEAQRAGLTRVLAAIHPGNAASRHVHEKLGFTRIGPIQYSRVMWRERFEFPEEVLR